MAILRDVCSKITDGSHNPPTGIETSEYMMLSSKNIEDDNITYNNPRYLDQTEFETEDRRTQISSGDLLMTIVGTVGRVAVVDCHTRNICLQRSVAVLKPKAETVDSRFLMYQIQSMRQLIENESHGVAQKGIYLSQVEKLPIILPDLPTQRRIAATLDKVSEGIALCKQMLADLDELVKSQFVEMFGAIDSNEKGWLKEPLLKHAEVLVGYPFPSTGYAEEGIKIVGGYNLMQGYINWEDSKHWPDPTGYEQYLLKEGDIVMAMDRPWTGDGFKMAFIEGNKLPSILIQRTACIRSKDLSNEFLYAMLNSTWFAEHCDVKGSLVPHISNKDINSFSIFIPPVELQREYAAFYQQADKSKIAVQQQLAELETLKKSLMQEYFG